MVARAPELERVEICHIRKNGLNFASTGIACSSLIAIRYGGRRAVHRSKVRKLFLQQQFLCGRERALRSARGQSWLRYSFNSECFRSASSFLMLFLLFLLKYPLPCVL